MARCHIRTNGILMDKLHVNLIVQQLHGGRGAARPCRQSAAEACRDQTATDPTWAENKEEESTGSQVYQVLSDQSARPPSALTFTTLTDI